jgi:hypothetical protein
MMAELVPLMLPCILILGAIWWLKVGLEAYFDAKMQQLSEELAQVVVKFAETAQYSTIEPPNPMQQMLMGLIQQKITQNRGPDGQFLPNQPDV